MNRALPTIYNSHLAGRRDTSLTDAGGRSRLTLRGFWGGAFLSFFLAIGAPYTNMAMRSTNMAFDFNTPLRFVLFNPKVYGRDPSATVIGIKDAKAFAAVIPATDKKENAAGRKI